MRRFLVLLACLLGLGALLGLAWNALRPREKALYLPEAKNDRVTAVIGLPGGGFAPASSEATGPSLPAGELPAAEGLPPQERSVQARPAKDAYPAGTREITLVVTNRTENPLGYTGWFDFRRVDADGVTPLTPREDALPDPADPAGERTLEGGATVELTVPIDLFDQPLGPGVYRAAQLCCFTDDQGNALACTEITADFTIE